LSYEGQTGHHQLERRYSELFLAGLADSTRQTYKFGAHQYLEFCNLFSTRAAVTPFPISEVILTYFIACSFKEGLTGGTIKGYLADVRHAQISLGLGDPRMRDMPRLEYVIKDIRRSTAHPTRKHLPIIPDILLKLKQVWQPSPDFYDTSVLLCVLLWLGEVVAPGISKFDSSTNLCTGDVRVDNHANPQYLEVRIKASKTDPFRQGVLVYLGVTHSSLCPVAAILY